MPRESNQNNYNEFDDIDTTPFKRGKGHEKGKDSQENFSSVQFNMPELREPLQFGIYKNFDKDRLIDGYYTFCSEVSHILNSSTIQKTYQCSLVAIVVIAISYLSGASQVVFSQLIPSKSLFVQMGWRSTSLIIWAIPVLLHERAENREAYRFDVLFSKKAISVTVLQAFYTVMASLLFLFASRMTYVSHTCILANLTPLLIVTYKYIKREVIQKFEVYGCLIAVIGSLVIVLDPPAEGDFIVEKFGYPILGDILAFSAAFFNVLWYSNAAVGVKMMPIKWFSAITFIAMTPFLIVLAKVVDGIDIFSTDRETGFFNFLHADTILYYVAVIGLICSLFGGCGYTFCLKYASPLVLASLCLLEPLISQLLACFVGIDPAPGIFTYCGSLLISVGLLVIIKGESTQ